MDTQVIEILGLNYLVNELLRAGFEVAHPIRDRGIDLIAYIDLDEDIDQFFSFPIQLKASSNQSFSIARKYNKFPNLILTYVWNLRSDRETVIYALTQQEAVAVGNSMQYTLTPSWIDNGLYVSNRPSKKLVENLEPFLMNPQRWREKLLG